MIEVNRSATFEARHAQMFPVLTAGEMERLRRFAAQRRYADGELLFETGKPSPGMLVVLSGTVRVTSRDGHGHDVAVVQIGSGQFSGEAGSLSGNRAFVDGRATGPDVARLRNFLTRNGIPHMLLDPAADPATDWLKNCGVALDDKGFVRTGSSVAGADERAAKAARLPLEASVPGVFAIGDVRAGSVKRVGGAIGEGAAVVAQIHTFIARPEAVVPIGERA